MREIRIFESHAHYDDKAFDDDRDELLRQLADEGYAYIMNIASDLKSVDMTYELTQQYEHVYAAIGIHPSEVEELNENTFQHVREVARRPKVLAIGEIGLDYHYDEPAKDVQKDWFERQLMLARQLNKPVVIHSRDATEDTMKILKSNVARDIPGVMHCYSYSAETAAELLKLGYYFGIGGVITFSNARKLVEAVQEIPLDRILLETDCPYLAPTPHRGERNSSLYIPLIAEKIAAIKDVPYHKVLDQTYKNARKLFFNK
jgi:TatD DNase family protein